MRYITNAEHTLMDADTEGERRVIANKISAALLIFFAPLVNAKKWCNILSDANSRLAPPYSELYILIQIHCIHHKKCYFVQSLQKVCVRLRLCSHLYICS